MNAWIGVRPGLRVSVVMAVCCLLMQGCKKPAAEVEKPVAAVEAVHPVTGEIAEEIVGDATLAPVAQAAIASRITSPVKQFYVQRGSRVAAGQLVATLENADLAAAAIDNQGSYTAAKGAYTAATGTTVPEEETRARLALAEAKATLELDTSILTARQKLLAQGAIPGRDVDTANATVLQAQAANDLAQQQYDALRKSGRGAALETAKGTLESARGKLLGAEAQLGYTQLRSPIRGVVTDRPLFVGETAAAGTAVVTIMDTSVLLAKMHLAQRLAQQLVVGSEAELTVPGVEGTVAAKVSLISPAVDPGSTTVEVWLRVENAKGTLKAGAAVHATMKGRVVRDALLIPVEALQRSTEGAGKIVMVVAADGTAKKRAVTVGIQTPEQAQIVEGLTVGDQVITTGGYGLDDGTKVKVEAAGEKPSAGKEGDAADKHGAVGEKK